jgi:hypothetical protein
MSEIHWAVEHAVAGADHPRYQQSGVDRLPRAGLGMDRAPRPLERDLPQRPPRPSPRRALTGGEPRLAVLMDHPRRASYTALRSF